MFCRKERFIVCSVNFHLQYFVGGNVAADCLKNDIIPLIKAKEGLKFDQYVKMNHVRRKGKLQ